MTGRARRLLIWLGAVIGLLISVLALAPLFIDMNAYRDQAVAEVKKATGRDLVLGGPISLRLLPTPTVRAEDVKVFNLPDSKNPDMVTIKSVAVSLSLWALLFGRLEVSDVVLV
jgi:AsmA protein